MERVSNLTQAYSQAPWRKQMQIIGLFLLIVVFIALVAGIYLSVTARAATIGRSIQRMQSDIKELEQGNIDLRSRLSIIRSSAEMEKRAIEMGFRPVERDEAMFIVIPGYVERQPVSLAPSTSPMVVSAPVIPSEYTESLFDWLQRQIMQPSFMLFEVQE